VLKKLVGGSAFSGSRSGFIRVFDVAYLHKTFDPGLVIDVRILAEDHVS